MVGNAKLSAINDASLVSNATRLHLIWKPLRQCTTSQKLLKKALDAEAKAEDAAALAASAEQAKALLDSLKSAADKMMLQHLPRL